MKISSLRPAINNLCEHHHMNDHTIKHIYLKCRYKVFDFRCFIPVGLVSIETHVLVTAVISDHNVMIAKFSLKYTKQKNIVRREIFNFKDKKAQKYFHDATNISTKP